MTLLNNSVTLYFFVRTINKHSFTWPQCLKRRTSLIHFYSRCSCCFLVFYLILFFSLQYAWHTVKTTLLYCNISFFIIIIIIIIIFLKLDCNVNFKTARQGLSPARTKVNKHNLVFLKVMITLLLLLLL